MITSDCKLDSCSACEVKTEKVKVRGHAVSNGMPTRVCMSVGLQYTTVYLQSPANHHFRQKCDIFTARCTTVQSAVLLSHVVCPSVHLWRWWIM